MINFSNKKIVSFSLIGLIIIYSVLTNWVETKMIYPEEKEWFELNIWAHAKNESCIDLGESNIYYLNDPTKNQYLGNWNTNNLVHLDLNLRKICDFGQLRVYISATNLTYLFIAENSTTLNISQSNDSRFDISMNYDVNIPFYRIELILPIKNDFFNYYRFSSPKIPINVLTFYYKNGVFNEGYSADENSFTIFDQAKYTERPIEKNRYKWYNFNREESVLLTFNPKSKIWSLIQKMIDAIVLGLITVMVYELLPRSK